MITVTREGNKLILQQSTSGQKRELLAESENSFFMKEDPRPTYSFVKDATGQSFFALSVGGREVGRAKKVK